MTDKEDKTALEKMMIDLYHKYEGKIDAEIFHDVCVDVSHIIRKIILEEYKK